MKTLSHFSNTEIISVYSVTQTEGQWRHDKPRGLWVSCDGDDDWPAWCKSEDYCDTDAQLRYRVHLIKDANILYLKGPFSLDAFTEQYGAPCSIGGGYKIRWEDVAKQYQGIIIPDYIWARRLHDKTGWYYGWDCASGCIWDAAAIDRLELVNAERRAA